MLSIDWPDEPRESQSSKLGERVLIGPNSRLTWRKLPFFRDLHHDLSRSWKQPFSYCLTNAAAADFTNLGGSVEQGYTAIPVVEGMLASHLSPSLAPSWKSRTLLPTKPCRTTSALIGKTYMAAGQAGMALHTMDILQANQADVLKEKDEGGGLTPEGVKELRKATDLALRATKHTARAVGPSRVGSVAAERHLWLNLTEIREKEFFFLLDAPSLKHRFVRQSGSGRASQESFQCPLWFSLSSPAPLGIDALAHPWPDRRLYTFSASQADSSSPLQGEGEQCPFPTRSPVLAIPDVVLGADSSSISAPLGDSDQAGPALAPSGQDLAPSTRDLEAVGVAQPRPQVFISSLPAEVQETIANTRAPATRKLYSYKWRVFESWCLTHAVDPVNCPIGPVLEFLQVRL